MDSTIEFVHKEVYDQLVKYAHHHHPEAAEDLVQEAFLILLRKEPSLGKPGDSSPAQEWQQEVERLTAFLHCCVRKLGANRRRRRNRRSKIHSGRIPKEPHDPWARFEARMTVDQVLMNIPDVHRKVLKMRYLDGRSFRWIADELEISEAAARKRVARGRAAIRKHHCGYI